MKSEGRERGVEWRGTAEKAGAAGGCCDVPILCGMGTWVFGETEMHSTAKRKRRSRKRSAGRGWRWAIGGVRQLLRG
jgi:hypothetical protein